MKVAFDAMMNLHYLKMGKDETIPEFYRRAQTAKEIVDKTLGGPIKLTALITAEKQAANQNQAFLATIIKANREAAFDRCMAFVLIHKAYKPKFGSLMQRLEDAQCTRITGRESSDYRSALVEIFDVYEAQGFNVARIHADQEFRSTIVALQQEGKMLSFNLANAQEHQPQVWSKTWVCDLSTVVLRVCWCINKCWCICAPLVGSWRMVSLKTTYIFIKNGRFSTNFFSMPSSIT
jgi:hypothetical protein